MKTVTQELLALRAMDVAALHARYVELFGREPRSRHREHLYRRLAYRIQERAFGGLSSVAKKRLDGLIAEIELPTAPPMRDGLAPGTVLTRVWHDRRIEVRVLDDGRFEFEGASYRSLSAIAGRVIDATGRVVAIGDLFRIQSYTQQEGGAFRWITIPEDVNMIGDEVFDPVQMHKLYDIGQRMALQEPRWLTQLPGRRPDP